MHRTSQPYSGVRGGAAIAIVAIVCGTIGMLSGSLACTQSPGPVRSQVQNQAPQVALETAAAPLAQDDSDDEGDDKDVSTSQVDKYISVYQAMQKDHSLTVEDAASKQGLTVAQFRELENKIENDDTLRERVRKALRHAANPKATDAEEEQ